MKYLILFSLLMPDFIYADVPVSQVKEVKYLLEFVKSSACIINRNGTDHTSENAANHIKRKYDYYRDEIDSTEKFINLSATKSIMSGNFYTVSCKGKETIRTQDWLLQELKRFREKP